jgi:hypothetical protein
MSPRRGRIDGLGSHAPRWRQESELTAAYANPNFIQYAVLREKPT